MNDLEALAVAQAVFKRVSAAVSTKDPDNLRGRCDATARAMYEATGAKSFDVKLGGEKVGTYSVRVKKKSRMRKETVLTVTDPDALAEFCAENADDMARYVQANAQDVAEWFFEDSGMVADGVEATVETIPSQPERYDGTTLKVDPDAVGDALQGQLPEAIAGLLEDGSEH